MDKYTGWFLVELEKASSHLKPEHRRELQDEFADHLDAAIQARLEFGDAAELAEQQAVRSLGSPRRIARSFDPLGVRKADWMCVCNAAGIAILFALYCGWENLQLRGWVLALLVLAVLHLFWKGFRTGIPSLRTLIGASVTTLLLLAIALPLARVNPFPSASYSSASEFLIVDPASPDQRPAYLRDLDHASSAVSESRGYAVGSLALNEKRLRREFDSNLNRLVPNPPKWVSRQDLSDLADAVGSMSYDPDPTSVEAPLAWDGNNWIHDDGPWIVFNAPHKVDDPLSTAVVYVKGVPNFFKFDPRVRLRLLQEQGQLADIETIRGMSWVSRVRAGFLANLPTATLACALIFLAVASPVIGALMTRPRRWARGVAQ